MSEGLFKAALLELTSQLRIFVSVVPFRVFRVFRGSLMYFVVP